MTSTIKVNTVTTESGCTVTLGESGKNVVVANNDIRSDNYKAADGGVIVSQSGTTITLGASGDTITLASGASQTGFGREGSVDWQTGSIKTTTFTPTSGEGYFVDTSSGGVTANLPAGVAGAIVAFADYTRTFQTNNLTIVPNGSNKIGGVAANASLNKNGQSATFVFVDATEGWINVQETQTSQTGVSNLTATGGTVTTSGDCKIHTFTGPGTFCVSSVSSVAAENVVSYMVIAGAGSGGGDYGGGGGAGGYREVKTPVTPYTASPLDGYPTSPNQVTVTATAFPITVGAGGSGVPNSPGEGNSGSNSIFSTITSAGGGGAGGNNPGNGKTGGSGGGSRYHHCGASGNVPSTTPAQGNDGGDGQTAPAAPRYGQGGGGGAGGAGGNPQPSGPTASGVGGNGTTSSITASPVTRAGGGGAGGGDNPSAGSQGGPGGAGDGGTTGGGGSAGTAGTANTGSGGGGGGGGFAGGAGGSEVVVIRYKYQ